MQSEYYVTEVSSKEDINQAISLWKGNLSLPVGTWKDKYHWFYERNPYRKGKLWLLKFEGTEKAVGVGGIGYRRFAVKGESLIGAIAVDLAVQKKHRALGPALQIQKTEIEAAKKNSDFLYAFPSEQAEVILKHFGYEKIAEFTRLVKILRSADYLKRVVKPGFLAGAISIPVDLLLRLRSINTLWASGNVFHSDSLEGLYSSVDGLWNQIAQQGLLMGERSSGYLDWRYFKCPIDKYKVFGIKDKDNALQAAMVYFLQDKRAEVVDLICPDYKDTTIIHSLFTNFEKYCLSLPVDSIEVQIIGCKRIVQHLVSMGYSRRKDQNPSVFVNTGQNNGLLAQFKDLENSLWFAGDLQ